MPLDDERRWYRYHHLFADALRARLAARQPDQVCELHAAAGEWFAENGLLGDAVRHAIASGDYEHTADLVELSLPDLRRRRQDRILREWLASLPDRPPLAAVFNNAGVAVASSVLDSDPGDDEWLRQINFDGVVNGTRAFLPLLVEQDDGVIVNTSSVFGLAGMPYQSAYCASKFAVRGFTDSLRQELRGTGVRAVTVHPGGIKTNIARSARVRTDPTGLGRSQEQMAAEFEQLLRTTPAKAAEIICRGVDAGKARILVGPDAYVFDTLARVAPTHYYDVMAVLEKRLRAGAR